MNDETERINSEFDHLLNVRTANVLRRWNVHLSEVGGHSAREFMREPNFGRHALANLVEACIRAGFDPPSGLDEWEAQRVVVEALRSPLAGSQPGFAERAALISKLVGSEHVAQSPTAFESLALEDIVLAFEEMLDRLADERLQMIASHRLFLAEPMALAELGATYGVSRERIRQLEVKVVRRLRAFGRRNEIVRACNRYLGQRCSSFEEAFSSLHAHLCGISRDDTAISLTTTLLGVFCDSKIFGVPLKRALATARALLAEARKAEWKADRDRRKEDARVTKREEFFQRLMRAVRWPGNTPPNRHHVRPPVRKRAREINFDDETSLRGSFTSAREGYGEIHFESSLERTVLEILDASSNNVAWFSEQPLSIHYRDRAGLTRTYFPDILLSTSASEMVIVECKPVQRMVHLDTFFKARGATEFAETNGWGYVIVDDRGITLRQLIERDAHASERDLHAFLERSGGSILAGRFFRFCRATGLGGFDITSAMLRLDLAYDTSRHMVVSLPPGSWRALTSAS